MERGRMKLTMCTPTPNKHGLCPGLHMNGKRYTHRAQRAGTPCKDETRAMKQVARTGKPRGYSWRLWHEWDGPITRTIPTTPIQRAWVTDCLTPAYRRASFNKSRDGTWRVKAED
jgi:hypothetical protein